MSETPLENPSLSSGAALWSRAKKIIPGGNQLLSKRPERFLPGLWPSYYSRAKGCEVWDLDNRHYYDFAQMGVGACVLGYADVEVNAAVIQAVTNGSMCTLNCPEEVQLAERLLQLHPWAAMARFARTGGEACAIAIRIARAASGKDRIALCGYHGWHDWYLSANLSDSASLDGQLLPGLDPAGVPRTLSGTALTFNYNDLPALQRLASEFGSEIGVIVMEPQRGNAPSPGFLEGVREIATRLGAVLILDEVTSGFRMNLGGIHLTLGLSPDMAVFGKGLGNGYAISAILGRTDVMDHAQSTFISSTFWTERIGFAAALAVLDKMEKHNVPSWLVATGEQINDGWQQLSQKHGIPIHISGIPPLTHLSFLVPNAQALQTLYAQEMLAKGFLLGASVYTTLAYTPQIIRHFLDQSDAAFAVLRRALDDASVESLLKGGVADAGFKRLT